MEEKVIKQTIVFDFDGVIHRYSRGWQDGSIYDTPTEGIKETIEKLREEYKVIVVSTRSATKEGKAAILKWLKKYDIEVDDVMDTKPPATMYIDDRAVHFNGNCDTLMRDIRNFKCWVETSRKTCAHCGKEFFIDGVMRNRSKYCSIECRIAANIEKEKEKKQRFDPYTKRYIDR